MLRLKRHPVNASSFFQKTQKRGVYFRRVFLLNPVAASTEPDFAVRRVNVVRDALNCFGNDCEVALAVDEERGHAHSLLLRELAALEPAFEKRAEVRAVIVYARRECARLSRGGF